MNFIIDRFIQSIKEGNLPMVLESYADVVPAGLPDVPGIFYFTMDESKEVRKMLIEYLGKNGMDKENLKNENINTLLVILTKQIKGEL